jgi:hypothetical protein
MLEQIRTGFLIEVVKSKAGNESRSALKTAPKNLATIPKEFNYLATRSDVTCYR